MSSSQWVNCNHLFCRKVAFLIAVHCQFRDVGQAMKLLKKHIRHVLRNRSYYISALSSVVIDQINGSVSRAFINKII